GTLPTPMIERRGVTTHNQIGWKAKPGAGVPLIVEHEVVNLPSASVLAEIRKQVAARTPAAKSVAVLAGPVFDRKDGRVTGTEPTRKQRGDYNDRAAQHGSSVTTSAMEDKFSLNAARERVLRSGNDTGVISQGSGFPRLAYTRREANMIMA